MNAETEPEAMNGKTIEGAKMNGTVYSNGYSNGYANGFANGHANGHANGNGKLNGNGSLRRKENKMPS